MRILALDLGKNKTAAYLLDRDRQEQSHTTVRTSPTSPTSLHDLIVEVAPDRVVFEICPLAGWLSDVVRALRIQLQVVNVAHDAWRWRNVRAKSDRLDAIKLAELSLVDQLSLVHVPDRDTRQWRSLIAYRKQVVSRRTPSCPRTRTNRKARCAERQRWCLDGRLGPRRLVAARPVQILDREHQAMHPVIRRHEARGWQDPSRMTSRGRIDCSGKT